MTEETRDLPTRCEMCGRDDARMIDYLGAWFCASCEKQHKCKTIIYCKTKKETETIAESITNYGIPTKYYHGD